MVPVDIWFIMMMLIVIFLVYINQIFKFML